MISVNCGVFFNLFFKYLMHSTNSKCLLFVCRIYRPLNILKFPFILNFAYEESENLVLYNEEDRVNAVGFLTVIISTRSIVFRMIFSGLAVINSSEVCID